MFSTSFTGDCLIISDNMPQLSLQVLDFPATDFSLPAPDHSYAGKQTSGSNISVDVPSSKNGSMAADHTASAEQTSQKSFDPLTPVAPAPVTVTAGGTSKTSIKHTLMAQSRPNKSIAVVCTTSPPSERAHVYTISKNDIKKVYSSKMSQTPSQPSVTESRVVSLNTRAPITGVTGIFRPSPSPASSSMSGTTSSPRTPLSRPASSQPTSSTPTIFDIAVTKIIEKSTPKSSTGVDNT